MDLRVKSKPECWNYEALEAYANKISGFEEDHKKNLPRMGMEVGQIGCHGCNGNVCTAELSRTALRPGGSIHPIGEKLNEVEGFSRERPEDWGEAEVIDLRDLAA